MSILVFIKRHPVWTYFVMVFAISWGYWLVLFAAFGTPLIPPAQLIPFVYGPTLAAIGLTTIAGGRSALKELLSKFLVWRVGGSWILAVVFILPSLQIATLLVYDSLHPGSAGPFAPNNLYWWFLGPLLALPFGPLGEELGWRGYLLPRIQSRHTALASSLLIGVVWTFWHAPLFWATSGSPISGSPVTIAAVASFLALSLPLSIFFAWIYNNTKGSVLIAMALHCVLNGQIAYHLFPEVTQAAIKATNQWLALPMLLLALVVIRFLGAARLSRVIFVEGETMVSAKEVG
jgi:membrane protease YdiL (CAAX protease family)